MLLCFCKFYSTAPVLETGLFVMFNTLNTVPAGSQAFVLLMNNTIDTDVKYEALNSKDVSLVLYETAYVDLIWDGISSNLKIESKFER